MGRSGRRSGPRTTARCFAIKGHVNGRVRAMLRTPAELEQGKDVDPVLQTSNLGAPAEVEMVRSSVRARQATRRPQSPGTFH